MRRLEEAYPTAGLTFVEDANHLPAAIEDFFQLMAHDPQKEAFLSEAMRAAMRATISTALNHGYLQLAFLELDGKRAAAYLNFKYNDRLWVYNSGLDPQYYAVSAGWVLLAYLLRWSIEHGLPEFDFMRGNEDYKYRFGAVDRFVYHVRLVKN
jgi:CelD/BcsL family acetyltransferase involved in cellulose biosynthesis